MALAPNSADNFSLFNDLKAKPLDNFTRRRYRQGSANHEAGSPRQAYAKVIRHADESFVGAVALRSVGRRCDRGGRPRHKQPRVERVAKGRLLGRVSHHEHGDTPMSNLGRRITNRDVQNDRRPARRHHVPQRICWR
jgi:hypothetical protein